MRDETSVREAFARIETLDVVVGAAGIVPGWTGIAETDLARWDDVFAVNVRGIVATLKHAAPAAPRRRLRRPDRLAQLVARRPEHRELRREQARRARDRALGRARPRPPRDPRQRARPGPGRHGRAARADGRPRAQARGSRRGGARLRGRADRPRPHCDASRRLPTPPSSWRAGSPPGSPASCFPIDAGML